MKLTTKDLIKELSGNFPEYTEEQIQEMIYGAWGFFKQEIESGSLNRVRIKYFGTFKVLVKRVIDKMRTTETQYKNGIISKDVYETRKMVIERFLEKIKQEEMEEENDTEESD